MAFSNYRVERMAFGSLLCIALLMAFAPLIRFHDPNGARASDAFYLRVGLAQLQSELRIVSPIKSYVYSGASAGPVTATPGPLPMPFSLRAASIVPWCIFGALAFSLLALLDLLLIRRAFGWLSLAGGCLGMVAVLHVLLMGSDVESWTEASMSITELSSPGDTALATWNLIANSFLISPGIGLYMLTACLLLVPLLSFTRAVPRLRTVMRSDARIRTSQPIHIRPINSQYQEETCMSLDLSRSGLYLQSPSNHYYVGMEVYLTRNVPAGGPANDDEHGYVVRVEKMGNAGCRFAIHIISKA